MKQLLPLLSFLLLLPQPAFSWSGDAHRAIAEAAKGMLTPEANSKIDTILGNDDLAAVSTWLDDVRNAKKHHVGPLKDNAEAKDFNAKFPANDHWHYVNLPVGATAYEEAGPFASGDDVVHSVQHAIDVLEGKAADYTDAQALRILVHLVGDVHQPMHTVSGYFDVTDTTSPKLVTSSLATTGQPNDRGGNQLFYTKSLELHALWDAKLPQRVQLEKPGETLAGQLAADASAQKWSTPGDYHHWAETWAGESAAEAIEAYKDIQFGQATLKFDGSIDRIEIRLPERYLETQTPRARMQLAKAAAHLAQLLNSLKFK